MRTAFGPPCVGSSPALHPPHRRRRCLQVVLRAAQSAPEASACQGVRAASCAAPRRARRARSGSVSLRETPAFFFTFLLVISRNQLNVGT
eukprot:4548486-Prymnesium_polylepis.2